MATPVRIVYFLIFVSRRGFANNFFIFEAGSLPTQNC